jgi:hypothetical protein
MAVTVIRVPRVFSSLYCPHRIIAKHLLDRFSTVLELLNQMIVGKNPYCDAQLATQPCLPPGNLRFRLRAGSKRIQAAGGCIRKTVRCVTQNVGRVSDALAGRCDEAGHGVCIATQAANPQEAKQVQHWRPHMLIVLDSSQVQSPSGLLHLIVAKHTFCGSSFAHLRHPVTESAVKARPDVTCVRYRAIDPGTTFSYVVRRDNRHKGVLALSSHPFHNSRKETTNKARLTVFCWRCVVRRATHSLYTGNGLGRNPEQTYQ